MWSRNAGLLAIWFKHHQLDSAVHRLHDPDEEPPDVHLFPLFVLNRLSIRIWLQYDRSHRARESDDMTALSYNAIRSRPRDKTSEIEYDRAGRPRPTTGYAFTTKDVFDVALPRWAMPRNYVFDKRPPQEIRHGNGKCPPDVKPWG